MWRQNMNLDGKIVRRKCKVRKRGCSSSSSSSNYRLKRSVLVARKSTTSVPMWKLLSSKSPSMENNQSFSLNWSGERGKDSCISARKLAATLWEMNAFHSPKMKRETAEEGTNTKIFKKEKEMLPCSSHLPHNSLSQENLQRRRANCGSVKLLQNEGIKSVNSCLLEVDGSQRNSTRSINRLKDLYNGIKTSKELITLMSRVCDFDHENTSVSSLFSALRLELNRMFIDVTNLLDEQKSNKSEITLLLGQFEKEKIIWRMKEQGRIHSAIASVISELDTEKKMRQHIERLNDKLSYELAETKKSLSNATKKVEKMKQKKMVNLAGLIRDEHVEVKLSEAKYKFEDENAGPNEVVNTVHSPSCDKIVELEKYLRETLPGAYKYEDEEESELHSIELNVEDLNKGIQRTEMTGEGVSTNRSNVKESKPEERCVEWEFCRENFDRYQHEMKDKEEMERYKMIKDLRDRIVSGARVATPEDRSPTSSKNNGDRYNK